MSEIILPHGQKKKLADDFRVSAKFVWEALTGKSNTNRAKMIRKAAIERGGMVFDQDRKNRAQ